MSTVQTKPRGPARTQPSSLRSLQRVNEKAGLARESGPASMDMMGLQTPGAMHYAGPAFSLAGGNGGASNGSGLGTTGGVQFKLAISQPGDHYEREADSAADRVTSGGIVQTLTPLSASVISRMATVQLQADENEEDTIAEEEQEGAVQRCDCEKELPGSVEPPRVQRQEKPEEEEEKPRETEPAITQQASIQRQQDENEEETEPPETAVQAKLTVNPPNDRFEKEADGVAEKVMRMPAPVSDSGQTTQEQEKAGPISDLDDTQIQEKCADCEAEDQVQTKAAFPPLPDATEKSPEAAVQPGETKEAGEEGKEKKEEKEKEEGKGGEGGEAAPQIDLPDVEPYTPENEKPAVQTKPQPSIRRASEAAASSSPGSGFGGGLASVQSDIQSSIGGGSLLAPAVRADMEGRFGRDLSQVKIHTGESSTRMNRDLHSRAFTHQNDIYFNAGEYTPGSPGGKFLLAHELTHTVQQGAVENTVQRYSPPAQDAKLEPKPARTNDGGEVTGRMDQKIAEDENVQNQDDLSEEEREEKKKPKRGEVRQESGEIKNSGEAKPSVDRGAQAETKTAEQKTEIQGELNKQPPESEAKKDEKEEIKAPATPAEAAAQRAQAAQARAYAVTVPDEPQPFRQPEIKTPVDSAGEDLPRNGEVDTVVRGLGQIGAMLREKGYEMKRHATNQEMAAWGLESVLEREREDLARAQEGTATMQAHNEARQQIAEKSHEAHTESVQRQEFVAEKAPELAGKADEGSADSGTLAGAAREKADRSQSEIPDDEDARGDAEKQSKEMGDTAEGAESMDKAVLMTSERARQYQADAAAAAEQNKESETQITETDGVIAQTAARITEMKATNGQSQAQIDKAGPGPELIRQFATRDAQSGDELIAATNVLEKELNALQDEYLADMKKIESREAAEKRQQEEQKKGEQPELTPEERELVELAGMSKEEQEEHTAGLSQDKRNALMAALEKMSQSTPDEGASAAKPEKWTEASEGKRSEFKINAQIDILGSVFGKEAPDPRAEKIQEVENRRIERLEGPLDIADRNMSFLTAEQQRMLANQLVAESFADDIKNISVLQMGKEMLKGLVDPSQTLNGAIGSFNKMVTGFENIGNWEAWKKDPLGNLLQIAADITTGLAGLFTSIIALATFVIGVMVALIIVTWGLASGFAVPVIGWMGTVLSFAGTGAVITGALAVLFNYLAYIKNLHDAGTAETSRELFGNVAQMKKNASDGLQGVMAVGAGVGAAKMGASIKSGEFFAAVPRSPGAFVRKTAGNIKQRAVSLAKLPGRLGRGAAALFAGGKQGLLAFKERLKGMFGRRPPGHPGDVEVPETPQARQRHQSQLDKAGDKRVRDMEPSEFGAEMREAGKNQPKRVDPGSEHFKDYDVEVKSGKHTYRRRRDGLGWCRFSKTPKDCIPNSAMSNQAQQNIPQDAKGQPSTGPAAETAKPTEAAGGPSKQLVVPSSETHAVDVTGNWRATQFTSGQKGVVYILRDAGTGQILKIGKTEVSTFAGRFEKYATAAGRTGRKLVADVYTLPKGSGKTLQTFEKEMREGLVKAGNSLPWDNSGRPPRLGRPGPGVPGTRLPKRLRDQGYRWEGDKLVKD